MKNHSSFRIGGPADWMIFPESEAQLAQLLPFLWKEELPLLVLGRGSNLLVRDSGIAGVVIKLTAAFGGEISRLAGGNLFSPAGKSLSELCLFALEEGLSGLEFAYGIPGSVGGAIMMNAGAYGGEMKDVLVRVRFMRCDGKIQEIPATELALSYRHSIFAEEANAQTKGGCILGGEFALVAGDRAEIRAKMDSILEQRRSKQPLDLPSAGSTFKRPEGAFASALIDQCGLKGFAIGGAQVSEKHAGFVVNRGNASCEEILALVDQIQKTVREKTGYTLECEIKIIGME